MDNHTTIIMLMMILVLSIPNSAAGERQTNDDQQKKILVKNILSHIICSVVDWAGSSSRWLRSVSCADTRLIRGESEWVTQLIQIWFWKNMFAVDFFGSVVTLHGRWVGINQRTRLWICLLNSWMPDLFRGKLSLEGVKSNCEIDWAVPTIVLG